MSYLLMLLLLTLFYFVIDYKGPKEISLNPIKVFGMSGLLATDLIVHEYDYWGNLWATRGMIIYKLPKGECKFIRVHHVTIKLSIFWLNNFSLVRKLTQKPECIEMTVSQDGRICAFVAGYMLYCGNADSNFKKKLKLPHFGMGIGRGMMNTGLLKAEKDLLFFGEYFRNEERTKVNVYCSKDFGQNWQVVYEFAPGEIRHIHSLQRDPYTDKLWICTGDYDQESKIGWSDDQFNSIHFIGHGSQVWRSCQLVFAREAVYWGADTGSEDLGGIYRWDREDMTLSKLIKVDGALFFGTRLNKGTIVMSTDREDFPNEKDDSTRLYMITKNDQVREIICGTWFHKQYGLGFSFAKIRFQRGQGSNYLVLNFLNHKEVSGGDLVMISESGLNNIPKTIAKIASRKKGVNQYTLDRILK